MNTPIKVCARYTSDPTKFTASLTIEELLSYLNNEYLPVRDVYVQVAEGDSVTLHRVGSLRCEFISGVPDGTEHSQPSSDEPLASTEPHTGNLNNDSSDAAEQEAHPSQPTSRPTFSLFGRAKAS